MERPFVDVIVPTYRRADLLPRTLASVAAQTYRHWCCWIAEDGRSPETEACLRSFSRDPRFVYLPGPHFGFPAGPRNRALRAGKGKYIALLDDDDCWLPDKLDHQVDFLESHPDYVMMGVNALRWHGEPPARYPALTPYHEKVPEGEIRFERLLRDNCFIVASVMIRREALSAVGPFNENLNPPIGEDYEMWLRLATVGRLWFTSSAHMLLFEQESDTYYTRRMGRAEKYRWKANILDQVLKGLGPAARRDPQKRRLYALAARKRLRLLAGPGPMGLLRYATARIRGGQA